MILFDPDLDPDPAPARAARVSVPVSRTNRIPSARTLSRFLRLAQAAVRLRGQVTVLLTTDAAIRRLNRRFRGKNKATDVLSFPAENLIQSQEKIAGDLAISIPTARRQSTACGHSLAIEIKILMLHGLLHLAGYDHETDSGQMARRERVLRGKLGLPQGLIERARGIEGDGLQPVRKKIRRATALDTEGRPDVARTTPSGAEAQDSSGSAMYGLKPVPFTPEPEPAPFKSKNLPQSSVCASERRRREP
jgi:probable rRNA maturation factor